MYHSPTIPVAKSPASSPVNARRTNPPLIRKLTTGQLHPLDVFTRASAQYWEDYEGHWQKAFDDTPCFTGRRISAENLLKFSDNRSDTWWAIQRATMVDGKGIIANTEVGTHGSYEANKPVVMFDQEVTSTIIASPGVSNFMDLSCNCWTGAWVSTFGASATFDMGSVTVTEEVNCVAVIEDLLDGTFKCSITYTIPAGTDVTQVRQCQAQACSVTGNNWFTGDGVSVSCYVHKSYLRRSDVPDVYLETTDEYRQIQSPYDTDGSLLPNLKGLYRAPYQMINETEYSDITNDLGWSWVGLSIVPDGTIKNLPAFLVTKTDTTSWRRVSLRESPVTAGNTYCYSAYVTDSTTPNIRFNANADGGAFNPGLTLNLDTLTTNTPSTTGCASIEGFVEEDPLNPGVYLVYVIVVPSVTTVASDTSGFAIYTTNIGDSARFTPMQKTQSLRPEPYIHCAGAFGVCAPDVYQPYGIERFPDAAGFAYMHFYPSFDKGEQLGVELLGVGSSTRLVYCRATTGNPASYDGSTAIDTSEAYSAGEEQKWASTWGVARQMFSNGVAGTAGAFDGSWNPGTSYSSGDNVTQSFHIAEIRIERGEKSEAYGIARTTI